MNRASGPARRSFLVLQGLATPFLYELAKRLREAGHAVQKIHFCGADMTFWPGRAVSFRGRADTWSAFLAAEVERCGATDILLFGDCRPYHRAAVALARRVGLTTYIFEEGYIRPGFITLERGGTNGYSDFPRDPAVIRRRAQGLMPPVTSVPVFTSFLRRAVWDVTAQGLSVGLTPAFPHYRWHGPNHPLVEYAGWIGRFVQSPLRRGPDRRTADHLLNAGSPYYLMPLQLNSDYQIRVHSPYGSMLEAADEVIASFARAAPDDHLLAFKLHPLDPGLIPYRRHIARTATGHGVGTRIRVLNGGDLPALIDKSRGVVLVNSTTGILSLRLGRRTKALGTALYDIAGLTYQEPLDSFWTAEQRPDPDLFDAFLTLLLLETQVEGDYFTPQGIRIGVQNAAQRILLGQSVDVDFTP